MNFSVLRVLVTTVLVIGAFCSLPAQEPTAVPPGQAAPTQQTASPASPQTAPAPTSPATAPNGTQAAGTQAAGTQATGTQAAGTQATRGQNGTYTIQRTARLVVLDMVVTDAKGKIVTDLKRDDFHVTELGEPQTILNFEEAGAHTLNPNITIDSTADLDRLAPRAPVNIILLDEFNTHFEDMAFARYSLKKYLEKEPGKLSMPTMLIAVNLQHFTVLRDYTQNKDEILSALDHHFVSYPWQAQNGGWVAERYGTAFLTLRRVAEATIGHIGHKNMIWIGRGFPPRRFNTSLDTDVRVYNLVQECVNELRDARVTLYTIDPAGLQVNPSDYGMAAAFDDPFGGNYEFNKLAKATGGRTLYGRNDVDAEIGTAIRDGSSFYTLTYRPATPPSDRNKFYRIKVTVDRPGLTVTTREGYYLQYGPGRVDPVKPSRLLMSDLLSADSSTMVYDGVPITLEPSSADPESFTVHVDGRALGWTFATDTEPRHTEVVLMVSTFDKKDKELKRDAKIIKVAAPASVPPTGRIVRNVDLKYKIDHNPKAVRARFVVRVTASGRIGTADVVLGQQAVVAPPTP
jgi:VWFA-related protein